MSERIGANRGVVANWVSYGEIAPTVVHMLKLARLISMNFECLALGHGGMPRECASGNNQPAGDIVRDGDERWLLQLFREVPKRQCPLLLDVIEVHARKRQA